MTMERSLSNIRATAAGIASGSYDHEEPYKVLKVMAELIEGLAAAVEIISEGQACEWSPVLEPDKVEEELAELDRWHDDGGPDFDRTKPV